MSSQRKTAIVTGASQGIGAGVVKGFVERGFNVVANSRQVSQSTEVVASDQVALVDGDIGDPATAAALALESFEQYASVRDFTRLIEPAARSPQAAGDLRRQTAAG